MEKNDSLMFGLVGLVVPAKTGIKSVLMTAPLF